MSMWVCIHIWQAIKGKEGGAWGRRTEILGTSSMPKLIQPPPYPVVSLKLIGGDGGWCHSLVEGCVKALRVGLVSPKILSPYIHCMYLLKAVSTVFCKPKNAPRQIAMFARLRAYYCVAKPSHAIV